MTRKDALALVLVLAASTQIQAQAANVEQRDFAIIVDGKEAGQSRVTITVQEDGTTVVAGTIHVNIKQLVFQYNLTIDGMEWWKDGKLIGLKSQARENGKKTELVVAIDGDKLRVRINGQEKAARGDVWTSSFWKLADPKYHNKQVPILDAESGKEYTGTLQFVGNEQLTIANQPQGCYRFRVTGGSYPVDVWYDRYHRLVRQEFSESGHKTIVQLIGVRR